MGFTENVSNGGVRLVCKDPGSLPTDEPLSVKISLLDGKGAVVGEEKHPCRIAYVQKRQDGKLALGIQFLPDPDEA